LNFLLLEVQLYIYLDPTVNGCYSGWVHGIPPPGGRRPPRGWDCGVLVQLGRKGELQSSGPSLGLPRPSGQQMEWVMHSVVNWAHCALLYILYNYSCLSVSTKWILYNEQFRHSPCQPSER